jgi:Tfp pilus assembly protein PilN
MPFSRVKIESTDDIVFLHRSRPSGTADLLLYIEDQIKELLFADESLDDILYRFAENDDELLIAVGRAKTTGKASPGGTVLDFRIPSAVDLWIRMKPALKAGRHSLILGKSGNNVFLLCADQKQLFRVYAVGAEPAADREILLAVDKIRERYPSSEFPMEFVAAEPAGDTLKRALRERAIECIEHAPLTALPFDKATFEHWDFRLPAEVGAFEKSRLKHRLAKSGVIAAAAVAACWLLLVAVSAILGIVERRYELRWQQLHGSLHDIGYLQRQTGQCIAEITLCRKLSEKRTNRARLLEQIATTRPPSAYLETLQIVGRKKQLDKGKTAVVANDIVILKGLCGDGRWITEWMERLQKGEIFASVNLISMEKKGGSYHFTIECTPSGQ